MRLGPGGLSGFDIREAIARAPFADAADLAAMLRAMETGAVQGAAERRAAQAERASTQGDQV